MRVDDGTIQEAQSREKASMLTAMRLGVAEALRKHRDQGVPIITWDRETQQIVETPADQIPDWIDQVRPTA